MALGHSTGSQSEVRVWAEVANLRLAGQGTLALPCSELAQLLQSTNVDKPPTLSSVIVGKSRLPSLRIRNCEAADF